MINSSRCVTFQLRRWVYLLVWLLHVRLADEPTKALLLTPLLTKKEKAVGNGHFKVACNLEVFVPCIVFAVDHIYRVSQEECARLRESVSYVKVYRYNPKHLYPKLNGYGDNGQRKVAASCGSKYCNLHSWCVTRERWWPWEWNAVLIVPAWRLVACTGVGRAM